jgi:cytochrome c553
MKAMKFGLRVSLAALTAVATTVSVAAFQAGTPQEPRVSAEAPAEPPHADLPQWPYPPDSPPSSLPPDDGQPHQLPGSTKAYTLKQQVYGDSAIDWFPEMHPKAPAAVIDGKPGGYRACGSCHLINGNGKPEMQSLNGLPVAYMQQQLEDMKNDLRHGSEVDGATTNMILTAKSVSDADAKEALEYFHSIGPAAKWIRIVEAGTVPKIVFGLHGLPLPDPSGAKEPIGNRILEMPESYERTLLRDPTSGFVAYVPPGSLAKGEALVKTGGNGRTVACVACHGAGLRGMGDTIPPITGRSPTATARQLYDFKTGARHGKNSATMKPAVEKLTDEEIVDISAYLASLPQ